MKLSGEDRRKLRTLVIDAVIDQNELRRLLSDRMDLRLEMVAESGNLDDVVFVLINWLEAKGLTVHFIDALREERPLLTDSLAALRGIAAAPSTRLEKLSTNVGQLMGLRWPLAIVATALVVAIGWELAAKWPVETPADVPLAPIHAPAIWKKAFVVSGERIAYASPDNIYGVLEERLQKAERSVLIAIYEFTSPKVGDWLLKAVQRGVKVTVLLGSRTHLGSDSSFIDDLVNKGIEVVEASRGRGRVFFAYHPKLIVIDQKWVLIQTGNLTTTSVPLPEEQSGNRDTGIAVESTELAKYFAGLIAEDKKVLQNAARSEQAETSDRDPVYVAYEPVKRFPVLRAGGTSQQAETERPSPVVQPIRILPVHSPENYSLYVSELLGSAKESIDIVEPYIVPGAKSPTVQKLLNAIRDARLRNPALRVRLILGRIMPDKTVQKLKECCDWLPADNMRVLNPRSGLNLTNKLIIVDRRVSLVASANWSEAGVAKNREVGAMIDAPDIASHYREIFDVDWERGLSVDAIDDRAEPQQDSR